MEPKTRDICVYSLELLQETAGNCFLLRTVCSRGTYIRSLCESIAERLGTVAYVPFLLRTRSGPFTIECARTIQELENAKLEGALNQSLVSCEEATGFLPELRLPPDRVTPAKNGLETRMKDAREGFVRAYGAGEFLGIGEVKDGNFRLAIHLYNENGLS